MKVEVDTQKKRTLNQVVSTPDQIPGLESLLTSTFPSYLERGDCVHGREGSGCGCMVSGERRIG